MPVLSELVDSSLGTRMDTITKKQLTDRIADATGYKRVVVKQVVQQFLDEVTEELARGNRLEFRDFGVFEVRTREARTARNPRTSERVTVPAKRTVKFKPGRLMRESVQRGPGVETAEPETGNAAAETPVAQEVGRSPVG
jgi:integration host factor subunit beta